MGFSLYSRGLGGRLRVKIVKQQCLIIILAFILSGCASARVRHAVPEELLSSVRVLGLQDIRTFGASPSDTFKKDYLKLLEQENKDSSVDLKIERTYFVLAISGGGSNGAYGAGLLNGWSRSGTRPVFKIVTGISTGAIMAPFAFLGSKYDDVLKVIYTKYSTKDVMQIRLPFIDSFASTQPLERIIERYFDAKLLKEIALAHKGGRRLYVGTTNLDAQRLVVWDMGKLASIGNADALKLFRKIILASSSVPIISPPVFINVEVNDKKYDEMHVDGGISKQVFFLYDVLRGFSQAVKEKNIDISNIKYKIYVIRNGYVDSLYKEVPDKLLAIAQRAVDSMSNAQSLGDLYQLYVFTQAAKGDFNLAYIPATHISRAKEPFDLREMRDLFDLGFKEASQGYDWKKAPPGLEEAEQQVP